MEYTTRNLESDPGMTQAEALVSLQQHPTFKQGSIISGLHKRGNQWVAEVMVPSVEKTAEFPPSGGGDEGEEAAPSKPEPPKSDGGDDGAPEGGDGPPSPDGGDKKPEGSKEPKGDEAILHILTQILHALGGGAEGVGGPDALGPGGPGGMAPPPPKAPAGPPGAGAPPMPGKPPMGRGPVPMKPGMTPPGGTPVGAPAFSSVQGLAERVASFSGKAATITLTTTGTDIKQAVSDARPVVENFGYKVKQAKHGENGQIHILASRR